MRDIKWRFPSLPGESKDLASVKKVLAGEGDWTCVKEVLRCIIDTEAGTVALPERKLREQQNLLAIPTTHRRMVRKDIERLLGKLCSMHLVVHGAVAHIYHLQVCAIQG